MSSPRVFLACESTLAGGGGISRVARLVGRVLGEEQSRGALEASALALSDDVPGSDLGLPVEAARRSRMSFVYRVHKAALTHSHFIYDFVGMARAHCRLPLLRRPFMTFLCGIDVWEGTRPDRVRVARRSDFLVSISEYTRQRAERAHGGFSRARVCWPGTESDDPPATRRRQDGPPSVLILGRVVEGRDKGHAALIDCWPEVVKAVPEARLVVVGGGSGLGVVRSQANGSPMAASIDVRGFVPEDRIESVWTDSSVFAMPSRGEGFGLVYIEAMRHGLPVIGSTHDAAPEINLEGETGYNVNLDRPGELADRIIRLLRDRELAERLGKVGHQRWQEHFRYSAFRDRFLPILREFLG
ncbi:MAG: glycosyltransferase family 4 protein [Planctomycetota bacterium]|nr:glycosyltransferase family 4 protein [Planctomycetota bacterium]